MDRPRVFVTHSNLDNEFTERLVKDLQDGGAEVWVDFEQIASGNFARSINEGLGTCEWVILVQTPNSLASDWVREEVDTAVNLKHKKRIRDVIPVIAADCRNHRIPPIWDALHTYDATVNYERALAGVLRAIGATQSAKSQSYESLVQEAVSALGRGEVDRAEEFAYRALAMQPKGQAARDVLKRIGESLAPAPTVPAPPSEPTPKIAPARADPSRGSAKPTISHGPSSFSERGNVELISIPAGEFWMGDDDISSSPRRRVYLSAYSIGKTPVTVGQFKAYCQAKGVDFSRFPEPGWGWIDDHPMVNVSWQEAKDFCMWAGGDLPTEAQWEKAARGTDGRKYPWGNEWDGRRCCHSVTKFGDAKSTAPVDRHPTGAGPYGCLDMSGNVWEWCLDWYSGLPTAPDGDPTGPITGERRVLRGGSWRSINPGSFRSANRFNYSPTSQDNYRGFRLAGPP